MSVFSAIHQPFTPPHRRERQHHRHAEQTESAGVLAELHTQAAVDAPGAGRAADLNARELAVLRMLDVGRSNQQIAHALGVTVNTVKWYLKNIYAKLGATSRAEAVSTARRAGLLS